MIDNLFPCDISAFNNEITVSPIIDEDFIVSEAQRGIGNRPSEGERY